MRKKGFVVLAAVFVLTGFFTIGCGQKEKIVEAIREVEVTRVVEKVVKETVVVEKTVIVEKKVEVQIQVPVVQTPTPVPTATATAIPTPAPTATPAPPLNAVVDICKEAGPPEGFISPQKDYVVFHCLVSVTNQPVSMKAANFWRRGTLDGSKLSNFRLALDGVVQGKQQSSTYEDCATNAEYMNRHFRNICLQGVRFEPSARLPVGLHLIEVVADIAPGANGTFSFSMGGPSSGDLDVVGTQVLKAFVTVGGSSGQGVRTGEQTVR